MTRNKSARRVREHYGRENLNRTILEALESAGKNVNALTREDIFTIDEFHIRGRDATRELAALAGLRASMDVLDIGCGIGGPARTLSAEFGCRVTGIDLVPEFIEAAKDLSDRVGLSESTQFLRCDALDLPFADSTFDVVFMEHVSMNIFEKQALFGDIWRVLRAGGIFADYGICAGPGSSVVFPVPWSEDGGASHLISPEQYREKISAAGLVVREFLDVTAISRDWFQSTLDKMDRSGQRSSPLTLSVVMGDTAGVKLANMLRNLEENRLVVHQLAAVKPVG